MAAVVNATQTIYAGDDITLSVVFSGVSTLAGLAFNFAIASAYYPSTALVLKRSIDGDIVVVGAPTDLTAAITLASVDTVLLGDRPYVGVANAVDSDGHIVTTLTVPLTIVRTPLTPDIVVGAGSLVASVAGVG